jgi:cytosine/adenosine deaminase-related metal-dependent hydrolase
MPYWRSPKSPSPGTRYLSAFGPPEQAGHGGLNGRILPACARLLILPGLVNTQTQAPMGTYRGLVDELSLRDWLQRYIFLAEAGTVSPELVRDGTGLGAPEMIESGTTTFADMYYYASTTMCRRLRYCSAWSRP